MWLSMYIGGIDYIKLNTSVKLPIHPFPLMTSYTVFLLPHASWPNWMLSTIVFSFASQALSYLTSLLLPHVCYCYVQRTSNPAEPCKRIPYALLCHYLGRIAFIHLKSWLSDWISVLQLIRKKGIFSSTSMH